MSQLTKQEQNILLDIAKKTVESFVKNNRIPTFNITNKNLNQNQGAFVTLHKNNQLRGCIGQIMFSNQPLWQVVRDMAIAAASQDYRFSPITEDELSQIYYEISVLSKPTKVDNWQDIKLGKHGVIVKKNNHSGVFLPQVATETGWDLEKFLSQLCAQKAGLDPNSYKNDPDIELKVFTAQIFSEKDIR